MTGQRKNPFMITFGKRPIEYISRPYQTDEILTMFTEEPITNQIYIIRGPRGSGKTVLLADLGNRLERDDGWTVIRCAPTGNILHMIAEGLGRKMLRKKVDVSVNLSVPAIGGFHVEQSRTQPDDAYAIEDALRVMKEKEQKLLITVDEITNTPQMRDFVSYFQIWIGQDFPIFFLGTALFERIEELQNVQNLTFLYRAPKVDLAPLDLVSIANSYRKTLSVTEGQARELAGLTQGYSFAFQALGYIYWNAMPVADVSEILPDYDAMLSNAAYAKMWQEFSEGDRELCSAIANTKSSRVQNIRQALPGADANRFNQRRIRLKNRGIIDTSQRGQIRFALPRFGEFVKNAAVLYGADE